MKEAKNEDAGDHKADHDSKSEGQHKDGQHKPERAHAERNSDAGKR